jgi:pentose-5-phosphate-3-epimerase
VFVLNKIKGIGTRRTISISNTIKIIAKRKNRMEKGTRALWLGSNPHSNGEDFSRSVNDRAAKIHDKKNRMNGTIIAIDEDTNSKFIN